ncbi:MAG: DEAD/DEAH box helicase, partial [Syntrophothermus sp.]
MIQKGFLETPVEYLKGVGPARAEILQKEARVFTFGELLSLFPYRYVDRTKILRIAEAREDSSFIQVKGKISEVRVIGTGRGKRLVAHLSDESGSLELVWFQGIKWVVEKVKPGAEFIAFGKVSAFNGILNIVHPELELAGRQSPVAGDCFRPLYNSSEKLKSRGLDSKGISRLMQALLENERFEVPENLPGHILEQFRLITRKEAFRQIHFPVSHDILQKAQVRLKFEELFYIQLRLLKQKFTRAQKIEGLTFTKVGDFLNDFYHHYLKFELTGAQKRVIKEIRADLGSGKQMNRLLQGDVGSGKTLVALMTMLIALDNGYQACLMAPTEILATQHYATISRMLKGLDVKV